MPCIVAGQKVRRLRSTDQHLELDNEDATGRATILCVEHVLLAMPPRLVKESIQFSPALPPVLARQWRATSTWMAPHAKYFTPFWREQGLSGVARSVCSPLGEIHDASVPGGSAALFGFFGVPVRVRKNLSEDELRALCRGQLARMFGPLAATPKAEFIKGWALDPYTATVADMDGAGYHAEAPATRATSGPWCGRLIGIGSEWSPQFPGYVAGAMIHHHHALGTAATVLGMFLPSFFTGVLLFVDHILMTLTGMGFGSFASALVLLGVGWNFLYIGGTALLTGTYSPAERRGHKPSMTW